MKMRVASGGIQTHDTLYSRQMLYQLSYQGSSAGRVRIKHMYMYDYIVLQKQMFCCSRNKCSLFSYFVENQLNLVTRKRDFLDIKFSRVLMRQYCFSMTFFLPSFFFVYNNMYVTFCSIIMY